MFISFGEKPDTKMILSIESLKAKHGVLWKYFYQENVTVEHKEPMQITKLNSTSFFSARSPVTFLLKL